MHDRHNQGQVLLLRGASNGCLSSKLLLSAIGLDDEVDDNESRDAGNASDRDGLVRVPEAIVVVLVEDCVDMSFWECEPWMSKVTRGRDKSWLLATSTTTPFAAGIRCSGGGGFTACDG